MGESREKRAVGKYGMKNKSEKDFEAFPALIM